MKRFIVSYKFAEEGKELKHDFHSYEAAHDFIVELRRQVVVHFVRVSTVDEKEATNA